MYSSNVRELNFETCIQELASRLRNPWSDKIVHFIDDSPGKVHIYDIQSGKLSVRDAQIPTAKFPNDASWCELKNGNFFYTGGYDYPKTLNYAWEIDSDTYIAKEHAPMIKGRN